MTQMSSVIIVTVKPSVEYAKLCMSMRLDNVRYSATVRCRPSCDRQASRPVAHHLADMCRGSVVRSHHPGRAAQQQSAVPGPGPSAAGANGLTWA